MIVLKLIFFISLLTPIFLKCDPFKVDYQTSIPYTITSQPTGDQVDLLSSSPTGAVAIVFSSDNETRAIDFVQTSDNYSILVNLKPTEQLYIFAAKQEANSPCITNLSFSAEVTTFNKGHKLEQQTLTEVNSNKRTLQTSTLLDCSDLCPYVIICCTAYNYNCSCSDTTASSTGYLNCQLSLDLAGLPNIYHFVGCNPQSDDHDTPRCKSDSAEVNVLSIKYIDSVIQIELPETNTTRVVYCEIGNFHLTFIQYRKLDEKEIDFKLLSDNINDLKENWYFWGNFQIFPDDTGSPNEYCKQITATQLHGNNSKCVNEIPIIEVVKTEFHVYNTCWVLIKIDDKRGVFEFSLFNKKIKIYAYSKMKGDLRIHPVFNETTDGLKMKVILLPSIGKINAFFSGTLEIISNGVPLTYETITNEHEGLPINNCFSFVIDSQTILKYFIKK